MRRERIIALLAMLVAVAGVTLLAPGRAAAATPQEICNDLIAHGGVTATLYSQAEIDAYRAALQSDPTIQGYCPPLVILTTPVKPCVEVAPNTPGAVQAQNGTWFTNAPNGNAEACTTPPSPCMVVPANTPGASEYNGTWYANAPGGNGANCAHTTAAPPAAPAAPTAGVAGATKVKQSPAPTTRVAAVSPATHTSRSAAPLATTRSSGTLPFTGLQLGVFAVVGLALLAGGLLLRATSRRRPDAS